MKEFINRHDRNGIQLREGDIIAECTKGDVIWEGKGIIKERPLGVVVTYPDMKAKPIYPPEETDKYNITQIRCGVVELTDKSSDWMNDGSGTCKLHLSRYDGGFYAWDNIERIGSVYDMDCV